MLLSYLKGEIPRACILSGTRSGEEGVDLRSRTHVQEQISVMDEVWVVRERGFIQVQVSVFGDLVDSSITHQYGKCQRQAGL